MTYLIRVPQHELRMRTGNRVDSPDNRHRDVMSLFGEIDGQPRKDAGILFRLERLPGAAPTYLIRSSLIPEKGTPTTQVREEVISSLSAGSLVSFRLSINAIQRLKGGGIRPVAGDLGPNLVDMESESEWDDLNATSSSISEPPKPVALSEWLKEKLAPALADVSILNHQREVVGAARNRARNTAGTKVIQVDLIDGVARVSDPEALRTLLSEGVGRARSYGCGLLTVNQLP